MAVSELVNKSYGAGTGEQQGSRQQLGTAQRLAPVGLRRQHLLGATGVVVVIALWCLASGLGAVRPELLPSPAVVLDATRALLASGELGRHLSVSSAELLVGLAPAVVGGTLLGAALACSRRLRYLLEPSIMALYVLPRVALLPLLVIWLGIGTESKTLLAFLGAVFPVIVNTEAGVRQVDQAWVRAARSLGASRGQVLTKILLPGALPAVVAGVRLGAGRAILAVVAGEMYVATAGAGHLLQQYSNAGRTAEVMAIGLTIALLGYMSVVAIELVERWLAPWRQQRD